jgi:hypothetical protein
MEEIGQGDYLIVGFRGNKFRGEIAPAIAELDRGHNERRTNDKRVPRTEQSAG